MSTPLFTAATVYAGGLGIGLAQDTGTALPLGWLAVGSISGVVTASVSRWFRARTTPAPARWFHTGFTATWTSATYAWLNWISHGTPWTLASAASVAAAAAVFTPVYAIDRYLRQDVIAAQWATERAQAAANAGEWAALLDAVGAKGVEILDQEPTRGGYALTLRLTHTTLDQLQQMLPQLETRKGDLRTGSLRLVRSPYASQATLSVTTRDVLGETINLPENADPLTIREPLTLGMLESGEPIEILFRQNSILVAGMKGSGKSVLLHVMISLLTRCTDAVIWMIDMAQGNTAKRWLRPWAQQWKDAEGKLIDRPILDWVATSPDEAVKLLNAALAVADGRARRMSGGKIQPKAEQPAVIVLSDENSDLMAWTPEAMKAKIRLLKKGRKAAVDVVDAVQRGTGPNTGGGEVDSQYDTTIGMRFAKKAEGQFVFPGHYQAVDLSKLPGRGALYLLDEARAQEGGVGPERGKVFYACDDDEYDDGRARTDIEELATHRWDIRPDLDADSQQDAAPFGYHQRWTDSRRIAWLCDALNIPTPDGAPTPPPPENRGTPTPQKATESLTPMRPIEDYLTMARNNPTPTQPDTSPPPPAGEEGNSGDDPQTARAISDALAEFERITQEAAAPPAPEGGAGEARTAALTLLWNAGPEGTGASAIARELADDFGTSRQTIVGWLKEWTDTGEAIRIGAGTKTRYVHHKHTR